MGITHLSGLEVSGVPTLGMSGIPATNGNVLFVSSTQGSDGNTGAADNPLATIAAAQSKATADHGDIIVLLAGHAETITAAGGITISKAGLTIWPLGEGADRPTITFGTSTAATFLITGANTAIGGPGSAALVGVTTIDQIVSPFVVQAADCTLNLEWHDGANNLEALRAILGNASAARLNVNLTYIGFTNGSHGVNAIRLVGSATANITVNYYGILTTAVVEFLTTASTNVQVNGYFFVSGTTNYSKDVVDTVTGSTWAVTGYDGAAGGWFDGGSAKAVGGDDISSVIGVQESAAVSSNAGVMVNAATIFTVAGGPIMVTGLCSVCQTANDATASTLQYATTSTLGSLAGTISGASATLASAVVGTVATLIGTALSTAPVISATGVGLMTITPIEVQAGIIKLTIGTGSTTGTWKHYMRYKPLAAGVTVT